MKKNKKYSQQIWSRTDHEFQESCRIIVDDDKSWTLIYYSLLQLMW